MAAFADAGGDPVLPPLYPAVWEAPLCLELLADPEVRFPLGPVVHVGGESVFVRPFRPSDQVRCRVELERTHLEPRGIAFSFVARHWNAAGQLCTESAATLLVRTRTPQGGAEAGGAEDEFSHPVAPEDSGDKAEPASWRELSGWNLSAAHGRRYARASGDYNPIHLWRLTSRPFGFRRPILHGFCTEALVAHALIEHRWSGDARALRRLRIAFRRPVALPSTVRLLVSDDADRGQFRVVGEEGSVLAEGSFAGG